jgi:hypothetical protein
MKTLYLNGRGATCVDFENKKVSPLESAPRYVDDVFVVNEPMHVIYSYKNETQEFDAEANDIVVTFYSDDYMTRAVVVKSEQWLKNIEDYNKAEQARKEKWAKEKATASEADAPVAA